MAVCDNYPECERSVMGGGWKRMNDLPKEVVKFTPGPWTSDGEVVGWWSGEQPAVRVAYQKTENTSSPVAMCTNQQLGNETAIANARLIAAAPDLYAALQEFDKATAETFWTSDDGFGRRDSEPEDLKEEGYTALSLAMTKAREAIRKATL